MESAVSPDRAKQFGETAARERKTIKKRRVIRAGGCFTSPTRVIPATRAGLLFYGRGLLPGIRGTFL